MKRIILILTIILLPCCLMCGCFADYSATPEPTVTATYRMELIPTAAPTVTQRLVLLTPQPSATGASAIDLDAEVADTAGGILVALTFNENARDDITALTVISASADGTSVPFTVIEGEQLDALNAFCALRIEHELPAGASCNIVLELTAAVGGSDIPVTVQLIATATE